MSEHPSLKPYECGPLKFTGSDLYDRHVVFDHAVDLAAASPRDRYEALARTLRDLLAQRWVLTQQTHERANAKRVYYLSMEFLIGRSLVNNLLNLGVEEYIRSDIASDPNLNWTELLEQEPDAGLGNGGLGRLAACFIDSLATLQIPAFGYGLRYEFGIFRQEIRDGNQSEQPDDWLRRPDPWEVARPDEAVRVPLACSFKLEGNHIAIVRGRPSHLVAVPHDRPVVGYGGKTVNTLRLWAARPADSFNFGEFSGGDFVAAMLDRLVADSVTRVLYPDDSTVRGQALRFVQEYFLVCASLADLVARFRRTNSDWNALPDRAAIQLNDTHPALAVPELMRLLLDDAGLGWDQAWDITSRTLAYTNHTLLPEALEKWPVWFFETICPRLLEVVFEINRRFLADVARRYPADPERPARMSLIEEGANRQVRMAHVAVVGTHSTNGVAAIHSHLLRTQLLREFAEVFPERFNNKTNGVTPRRWLKFCNPDLSGLLTEVVGAGWEADLGRLIELREWADDDGIQDRFLAVKRAAKVKFADWLKAQGGPAVDPDSVFDCQVKRIHEYKRQLLNALHVVVLYNRLRADPGLDVPPRTFFFAGKAAPAYRLAKVIIKFINNVAAVIDADPAVRGRIRVVFLPNYGVTLAERLIPAADVSEQISTAGYEASGTSNMKFMMNGALTVGTRDGATIEMAEEAGEENFFLFGLTAAEVAASRGWYNPRWHYDNDAETRAALDLVFGDYFSRQEPGVFEPLRETLLTKGDHYLHLADLVAYGRAHQAVAELYRDRRAWARRALLNVAACGKFSSDRTISEYAREVWGVQPCPVP